MNSGGYGGGQPPGGYPPGGGGGYPPQGQGGYGQQQGYGGYAPPGQPGAPAQPAGYGPAPGAPPGAQPGWGPGPQQPPQQQGWGQQQPQAGYGPPPGAFQQQGYGAPPGAAMTGPASDMRFSFEGTGGEMFGKMFVGWLLCGITLGIYTPWFICSFINYIFEKSNIQTSRGPVRLMFRGEGGSLFGLLFVNYLLVGITCGIYAPWAVCKIARYFADNTVAQTADGRQYQLRFTGEGGDLFGTWIVNGLLSAITIYIYLPWAMCNLRKWFYQRTQIIENGQPVGQLDFVGEGASLFGTFIVGMLLTGVTLGIYSFWHAVNLKKFFNQNTRVIIHGRAYALDFSGTGGELFVLKLVNGLLTALTLGIYFFWAKVKELKWEYQNTLVRPA